MAGNEAVETRVIRRLLIANRGEIALRIMRTAHELGIETIAIYGDDEEHARHVLYASEAWRIGEGEGLPYLRIDRILEIAKAAGADAIHPGYGFLSENPRFVHAVEDAGLIFVGPPAHAMEQLGDKISARKIALDAGVYPVPGTRDAVPTIEEAIKVAEEIGYPIAVKATAGGGGRGFRVAHTPQELPSAYDSARGEADRYFGNSDVFMERYVAKPRHIEVQVFGTADGRVIAFPERECSIQRRHQKLVEETPSPVVTPELRAKLQDAAIRLARAANYTNVGTFEFLLDENGEFYFMEINARVQVEHTITEMVTGYDIVREQLRAAQGLPATFETDRLIPNGHAIECRINAEDPADDFRPYPETIHSVVRPIGFGVRVDSSLQSGDTISDKYDSLISKLITWGRDRDEAISRMRRSLIDYEVSDAPTTIPFHLRVLDVAAFQRGETYTTFLETYHDQVFSGLTSPALSAPADADEAETPTSMLMEVNGHRFDVKVFGAPVVAVASNGAGKARRRKSKAKGATAKVDEGRDVVSPGQGTVLRILVEVGQQVSAGELLCVVESMKMENEVTAPHDGVVAAIGAEPGQSVPRGHVLVSIDA